MIGNINKGEDRRRKETVAFPFIFSFLPRATGTQSWDPVVVSSGFVPCDFFIYADSSLWATGRFR